MSHSKVIVHHNLDHSLKYFSIFNISGVTWWNVQWHKRAGVNWTDYELSHHSSWWRAEKTFAISFIDTTNFYIIKSCLITCNIDIDKSRQYKKYNFTSESTHGNVNAKLNIVHLDLNCQLYSCPKQIQLFPVKCN